MVENLALPPLLLVGDEVGDAGVGDDDRGEDNVGNSVGSGKPRTRACRTCRYSSAAGVSYFCRCVMLLESSVDVVDVECTDDDNDVQDRSVGT